MAEKQTSEQILASLWDMRWKKAYVAKSPYTALWDTYWNAYRGDYFKNVSLPEYKSNVVSNRIFSTIETLRPLMVDNDPKFQAIPRQEEAMQFTNDLQEAMSYEWDREFMDEKLYRELINLLVIGTSVFYIYWDADKKQVCCMPISAYNIFPDPLATTMEDAEYIIYPRYMNAVLLKRQFPHQAHKIQGSDVKFPDLVNDNSDNATLDNQVLVLEIWTWDYENEEYIDDQNNEKILKPKYPNGRKLIIAPELGLVLDDQKSPYDDGLPFVIIKDYDLPGKFWGEGEAAQLMSPQKARNDLDNAIIDNAKATANMPWIIDKNSGIPFGKITARPGLVIRKNPGTEVKRDTPPSMPMYVIDALNRKDEDVKEISGVFDTLKGDSATGVYTAQGILALQEAGQVRVRLKVKLLERGLGRICQKWFNRIKKYWGGDIWLAITANDGSIDLKKFNKEILKYDFTIKITAGSTMPVNRSAMLDLMVRLAQTPMPDGQNIVDREAIANYLPEEVKSSMLQRMSGQGVQSLQALQTQMQQLVQQVQQFYTQDQQDDQNTMKTLEGLTSAIEYINQQIRQLQTEHDKIKQEQMEKEKADKNYNMGYKDAEKVYQEDQQAQMQSVQEQAGLDEELPEELLSGIENMSDDELKVLIESHPDLAQLIK